MKFCLWKITSLGLKETSCFSLSNYLMTAVSLQHTWSSILIFAMSVGSAVSEGMRTVLPSWLNFSLPVASPPAYYFLQKGTKFKGQVDGDISKTSFQVLHQLRRPTLLTLMAQELMEKMWKIHILLANWATSSSLERLGLKSQLSSPPNFAHNHQLHHEDVQVPGSEGRWAAEPKGLKR